MGEILNQKKNTLIVGTGAAPRNLGHFTLMKSAFVDNGKVPTCPFWAIPTPEKANTFANTGPVSCISGVESVKCRRLPSKRAIKFTINIKLN